MDTGRFRIIDAALAPHIARAATRMESAAAGAFSVFGDPAELDDVRLAREAEAPRAEGEAAGDPEIPAALPSALVDPLMEPPTFGG